MRGNGGAGASVREEPAAGMSEPFDLSEVRFIRRVVVGPTRADEVLDENTVQRHLEELNRCLQGPPKGCIIGKDRGFRIIRFGEQQVVLEYVAYHVGFPRKPTWVDQLETGSAVELTAARPQA